MTIPVLTLSIYHGNYGILYYQVMFIKPLGAAEYA
jgi:hypothetical protein